MVDYKCTCLEGFKVQYAVMHETSYMVYEYVQERSCEIDRNMCHLDPCLSMVEHAEAYQIHLIVLVPQDSMAHSVIKCPLFLQAM